MASQPEPSLSRLAEFISAKSLVVVQPGAEAVVPASGACKRPGARNDGGQQPT